MSGLCWRHCVEPSKEIRLPVDSEKRRSRANSRCCPNSSAYIEKERLMRSRQNRLSWACLHLDVIKHGVLMRITFELSCSSNLLLNVTLPI